MAVTPPVTYHLLRSLGALTNSPVRLSAASGALTAESLDSESFPTSSTVTGTGSDLAKAITGCGAAYLQAALVIRAYKQRKWRVR